MMSRPRLSRRDVAFALNMAIACAVSYWTSAFLLGAVVNRDSDLLGGMWAAVATAFVFRMTREDSWSASVARLIATAVSFALCFLYLWFLPFTVPGMAALVGIGTLAMMLMDRRGDIITTGITTVVVMVAAAISPHDAWQVPVLRLADTMLGVGVGIGCKWLASSLYLKIVGEQLR